MAAPIYINGFGGSVTFGATSYPVVSWTVNNMCEILDTTNTANTATINGLALGFVTNIAGECKCEGSIKTFWDSVNNPYDAPIQMIAGQVFTLLLPLGQSGKEWSIPARIKQVTDENTVKGVVSWDIDFVSNGPWAMPS